MYIHVHVYVWYVHVCVVWIDSVHTCPSSPPSSHSDIGKSIYIYIYTFLSVSINIILDALKASESTSSRSINE